MNANFLDNHARFNGGLEPLAFHKHPSFSNILCHFWTCTAVPLLVCCLPWWESLRTSMTLRAILVGVHSQQGHPCRTGQRVEVRQSAHRKWFSWQQGKDYCSDIASLALWWCPCTAGECLERSLLSLCLSQYSSGLLGYCGAVSDHPVRHAMCSAGLIDH